MRPKPEFSQKSLMASNWRLRAASVALRLVRMIAASPSSSLWEAGKTHTRNRARRLSTRPCKALRSWATPGSEVKVSFIKAKYIVSPAPRESSYHHPVILKRSMPEVAEKVYGAPAANDKRGRHANNDE